MSPILLVRHAETVLNAERVVQYPDTPLSAEGRRQANRLAERLQRDGVIHVASSDYERAHATARVICDRSRAGLTVDPLLRERHLGTLRGRSYAEVEGLVFSDRVDPEHGESWRDFTERIDRVWRWVADLRRVVGGPLAVVTHGLVCRALAARRLTLPDDVPRIRFPNASVTVIDPEPPWRVRVLASRSHLGEEDVATQDAGRDITTI